MTYLYLTNPVKTAVFSIWDYNDCGGRTNSSWTTNAIFPANNGTISFETSNDTNVTLNHFFVNIDTKLVADDPNVWWLASDNETAKIKFCIRADLFSNGVSVSFTESKMELTLDMTKGIDDVTDAELYYNDPQSIKKEADMNFNVMAYQCYLNSDINHWAQLTTAAPLQQNSYIDICILPADTDVNVINVNKIMDLHFRQVGEPDYIVVANNEIANDLLTKVTSINDNKGMLIHTIIVSRFFQSLTNSNQPGDVTVSGSVAIEFDTHHVRRMEARERVSVVADESIAVNDKMTSMFSFDFSLDPSQMEATETKYLKGKRSSSKNHIVGGLIGGLAVVSVMSLLFIVIRRTRKNNSQKDV